MPLINQLVLQTVHPFLFVGSIVKKNETKRVAANVGLYTKKKVSITWTLCLWFCHSTLLKPIAKVLMTLILTLTLTLTLIETNR